MLVKSQIHIGSVVDIRLDGFIGSVVTERIENEDGPIPDDDGDVDYFLRGRCSKR